MSKIVTITFSPCIDKCTSVSSLIAERKLICSNPKLEPGGGGINVARAIKRLGGEATAIFPSGGYTGKFFNHLLELENIPSVIIETGNETRENIIVLDESSNNQYRFGMPGTELTESEWKQCLKTVEEIGDSEFIVASGSLPPGVPLSIYAQLAKIAKKSNAKFIVDTSGEALKQAVDEGVYLLKPNLGELSFLAGIEKINHADVEEVAKELISKNRCEIIVVSMGPEGAILVTENETYRAKPPQVKRKSTVGAGDSMVAGIVFSLSRGMDLEQALYYGVACGTAATMNLGTELFKKDDVEELFKSLNLDSAKNKTMK
jgi:6-phosphofructokinase 2